MKEDIFKCIIFLTLILLSFFLLHPKEENVETSQSTEVIEFQSANLTEEQVDLVEGDEKLIIENDQ